MILRTNQSVGALNPSDYPAPGALVSDLTNSPSAVT